MTLGGFACAASQLPLLLMRSQTTVRKLYDAKRAANASQTAVGIDPGADGATPNQFVSIHGIDDASTEPSPMNKLCIAKPRGR